MEQQSQASPQQQKAFEAMARQALQMLLSEQATEMILAGAQAKGPAASVADAVTQVLKASLQAAQSAGVQVDDATVNAAAQPGIAILMDALAEAGFSQDAEADAAEALRLVDEAIQLPSGGSPQQAQAPAGDVMPDEGEEF